MTSQVLSPDIDQWPTGSSERFIHSCWQLNMMRFHAFSHECGCDIREMYDNINHRMGIKTTYMDLLCLEDDYRNKSQLMEIVRNNKQPTWLWVTNCEVLLDTAIAGWLRSILTTYYTEHIRVTFLLDSQQQYREVFRRYSAPLYSSTMALELCHR
ncbi:hypothetical protein PL18_10190 [Vibrio renipiscarius]|uniref:Uncharacterized protein n=1 Tax=Vibrio renipiscarius TaxID=1461322 RepID=A0A0C2NK51_9VIBR|nr:hypothetical protein OJ16_14730 [Vibrio renipiscarius]KII79244.1 hypothetical protein PL18_10190 [Vibrio renipiscarius]